jgi:hypothetical protein
MGTEAHGTLTVGGQKVNVRADFASDHVVFSGGRRGEVPYSAIQVVGTAKGILRLRVDDAPMEFPLGDKAERIANKIRKPPTLMDKLGVKPGLTIAAIDVPSSLVKQLKAAVADTQDRRPGRPVDILFVGADSAEALDAIAGSVDRVVEGGSLWVVYPKGRQDTIREADVLAAGRAAGLKDVKVARISPSHTALKFMRPAS